MPCFKELTRTLKVNHDMKYVQVLSVNTFDSSFDCVTFHAIYKI